MKLTTKAQYAIAILRDVVANSANGPVRLSDVAGRTNLSLHYCEQVARKLRVARLLMPVRGPGGGYQPTRTTSTATLQYVFDAVKEKQDFTGLNGLALAVEAYLTTTTIGSLL